MKYLKKIIIIFFIIFVFIFFFKTGETNYKKQKEIQANLIEKPTSLPKSDYAKLTAFGFQNLKADFYRLNLIQYVGSTVIKSEYKSYLYTMTSLINNLNPYYEDPYILAELLLPNYNARYEKLDDITVEKYINQSIDIGENAVKNFCDEEKIKLIEKENNLEKLFTEEKYKNPCKKGYAVYNLAYIYFQYKKNPEKAVKYYKIASLSPEVPDGSKTMIAIMQSKSGEREKSFFMFLNMAKIVEKNNDFCISTATSLEKIGNNLFFGNGKINSTLIKDLEKFRKENFPYNGEIGITDTKCDKFLNKAIREINAYYLDQANEKFLAKKGENSKNALELFKTNFIDYIPIDFQQYTDGGIIYYFNKNTGNYDFKMGKYEME